MPEMPAEPEYTPSVCGELNCNTWEQTLGIITYFFKAREVEAALQRCNLVVRVPND